MTTSCSARSARGQRHADEHTLPHAAGELVRELPQALVGVGESGFLEHLDGVLLDVLAGRDPVGADRLLDLEPDAPHRVEVGHRVLRDEPDQAPAHLFHLLLVELGEVAAFEEHLAAGDLPRARKQVDDRVGGGGLAGT
jgi:hypothetical protein